jgi:hypothetical protein
MAGAVALSFLTASVSQSSGSNRRGLSALTRERAAPSDADGIVALRQ